MAYLAVLEPCTFKSRLTLDELTKAFREFAEERAAASLREYHNLKSYSFREENGLIHLVPPANSPIGTHYCDRLLAEFISHVIERGHWTTLELVGEDGQRWGYFITAGKVRPLGWLKVVWKGRRPIPIERATARLRRK